MRFAEAKYIQLSTQIFSARIDGILHQDYSYFPHSTDNCSNELIEPKIVPIIKCSAETVQILATSEIMSRKEGKELVYK